jgi:hypothetical protein
MDVFFLCPGGVLVSIFLSLESAQTKNLPGKSLLSVLEPSAVILNFVCGCQYFFKGFFYPRSAGFSNCCMPLPSISATLIGGTPIRALLFALGSLFR